MSRLIELTNRMHELERKLLKNTLERKKIKEEITEIKEKIEETKSPA